MSPSSIIHVDNLAELHGAYNELTSVYKHKELL